MDTNKKIENVGIAIFIVFFLIFFFAWGMPYAEEWKPPVADGDGCLLDAEGNKNMIRKSYGLNIGQEVCEKAGNQSPAVPWVAAIGGSVAGAGVITAVFFGVANYLTKKR